MTTRQFARSTRKTGPGRSRAVALAVIAAVASGLAITPALTAAASQTPGRTAASGTRPAPMRQPPYTAYRHARPPASETTAGMPPTAQTFYSVISSAGSLARGFQATGARRLATGTYQVDFTRNITTCAYIATIGLTGSIFTSPPGQITVVGRAGDPDGVFVQTFNPAGTLASLSFHLAVLC